MEQYEKGSSVSDAKIKSKETTLVELVGRLDQQVAAQQRMIQDLQKDIRRLKEKLDRHADHLNRQQRG